MRYGVVLLNFKWAQKTLAATLTVINDCTHIQVLLDKSGAQIANCDYDSDQISSRVQSASALFLVNRTYVTSCCGSRRCEAEAHKQSFLECAFNEGCWHCGWWSSFRSVPVGTNVALCSTRERERERVISMTRLGPSEATCMIDIGLKEEHNSREYIHVPTRSSCSSAKHF